jgi:uncharacterized repeat protein (TIGR01451 family)
VKIRRSAAGFSAVLLALAAALQMTQAHAGGPASLLALDVPYTQDFTTLASSGASSNRPAGWEFVESGTNANATYTAGTGSSNTGDTYSFGAAASADRALGGLQSGSLVPLVGGFFSNDTGSTITSLEIAYTGEQWRLGALARIDRLDFQYSLNATSLNTGTWVDVDALDFIAPTSAGAVGALDGQSAANRTAISGVIAGISVPPSATFRIRWVDLNASGADDGVAIDDFTLTPHGGGEPTLSVSDASVAEGDSGTMTASFTVTVSTSAHGGVTFDITTADGTGPTAATAADADYSPHAVSGVLIPSGQTSYTFDVAIHGDMTVEPDETFAVLVTGVSGVLVIDGAAAGAIVNDDEPPPVAAEVVISQVYGGGGNSGSTLTHDFIELFNRGTTTVGLDGWSLQYTSASGTGTWQVTPLTGTVPPGGYYLIQQAAGSGGSVALPSPDAIGTIPMGATAGKVALQVTIVPIVGACPAGGTADLVGYGGASCFEGIGPVAQASNVTAAIRKRGGCFDSDNNSVDFSVGGPTPRNSTVAARSCVPVPAAIHDIQGNGFISPFAGQDVVTSGIVTGIKSNGFFLQAPDGAIDADAATSEGIFVFTGAMPAVAVGGEVSARGTAGEFFGLTQVEASLPGDVVITGTGAGVPAPVTLTTATLDAAGMPGQLERFEGMRLHAPSVTSVAPTNAFGEIAAVLAGVPRPMREPGISVLEPVPPDPTSGVPDCCIPRFDENPERIVIDSDGLAGIPAATVTSRAIMSSITGPLDFSFGAYKLLPDGPLNAGIGMTPVPVPSAAADEFTVGSFNIENFAGSDAQKRKASLAIRQLMRSPDVIGHIEILDQATLQGLADQVNADTIAAGEPDPGYQAVLIPAPAGGTQNVGFLVKTARVRLDGVSQERAGDTFTNPANGQLETLHDRPPLVLRATADPAGSNPRPVIVVVNHLRSFIDIESIAPEGARVRAKRKAQAESVAGLLQELQTLDAGTAVISIGDYNAFQFNDGYTDPIATLKGTPTPDDQLVVDASSDLVTPDFANLTDSLPAAEQYSFIFAGTPQVLDHVLVNTVAASYFQRYAIARGNADFPEVFAGDASRPERSSDHDMPVAYFRFPPPSADLRLDLSAPPTAVAGEPATFTFTVTNAGPSPAQNAIVTGNLPPALAFLSCGATGGGVCGGSPAAPTATFNLLAPGESQIVTIVAAPGCAAPDESAIPLIGFVASDTPDLNPANNAAGATVVASNAPPAIAGAAASRSVLLLPLHQMVLVTISYSAADSCGPVHRSLTVTSDELVRAPVREQGLAGLTSPDWRVIDAHHVLLRAERSVKGDGRVYTIRIQVTDAAGGTATEELTVTVPRWIARDDDAR